MAATRKAPISVVKLNFDVLTTLASHFEAEDLLSWGMTCKTLYHSVSSHALWINVASHLQADRVTLPLPYGATVKTCDLKVLIKASSKASRLRRNLAESKPRLYRSTIITTPWLGLKGKDPVIGHVDKSAHIFDGRWILYRWNQNLYARHVEATKFKEVFDIPIVDYAAWSFEMEQLTKDVALVTMKNDIVGMWSLMEITFGEDKATKPRVQPIHLEDSAHLSLIGSSMAIATRHNQHILYDSHQLKPVPLEHAHSDQQHYAYKNGILFSVLARDDGVFAIVAQRVDTEPSLKVNPKKSRRFIKMHRECPVFPSGQSPNNSSTSIRCVSDDMLTIWHQVGSTDSDSQHNMLYVIEILYELAPDNLTTEPIEWGGWFYSSVDIPNGSCHIGSAGMSAILVRPNSRQNNIALAAYPREQIVGCEHGRRKINTGFHLPLPKGSSINRDLYRVDATWDDVHGILVVLVPSGAIWILRYA